jgi:uncharacterized protein YndB with AHSA1/START domain
MADSGTSGPSDTSGPSGTSGPSDVSGPPDTHDTVSVERTIAAPPERIFALLADPRRHREIDGSGTVVEAKVDGPERLSLGAKFGMAMRMGVPYSMVNTVVEFEDGRRIAWQPRMPGLLSRFVGGRIWRYELEPQPDGRTLVRETWDVSQDSMAPVLRLRGARDRTRTNMAKTLERLEAVVAA